MIHGGARSFAATRNYGAGSPTERSVARPWKRCSRDHANSLPYGRDAERLHRGGGQVAAADEPLVAYRTDDYRAIQAFVAAGLGAALLPRLALALMPAGIARVAVRPQPRVRRVSAARVAKSFRSPATDTAAAL
jgi:DNA-binding transcriptional LysR family regulator